MGTVKAFVDLYTSCGFNNQTLKLSPTSCFFFLDLLSLQKLFVNFSSIAALNACDQDRTCHIVCFQAMFFKDKQ